jgi:hypothetical protein
MRIDLTAAILLSRVPGRAKIVRESSQEPPGRETAFRRTDADAPSTPHSSYKVSGKCIGIQRRKHLLLAGLKLGKPTCLQKLHRWRSGRAQGRFFAVRPRPVFIAGTAANHARPAESKFPIRRRVHDAAGSLRARRSWWNWHPGRTSSSRKRSYAMRLPIRHPSCGRIRSDCY